MCDFLMYKAIKRKKKKKITFLLFATHFEKFGFNEPSLYRKNLWVPSEFVKTRVHSASFIGDY